MAAGPLRAVKAGGPIADLTDGELYALFSHPEQVRTVDEIEMLIEALRDCESSSDLYEVQRHLFRAAYAVDERRAQCAWVAKRLRVRRGLPSNSPAPPERGDPRDVATWEFDGFVHERLFRQFRAFGDGLAWCALGYNRRAIVALSRNQSPGPIVKRVGTADDASTGLARELGAVQDLWRDRRRFALLHDLTNCLRIGDITEIDEAGNMWLHEVKANPASRKPAQTRRIVQAIGSINGNAPLPGGRGQARFVELSEPYQANLVQLAAVIALARQHGCRGMKLSDGRALVATSPLDLHERCNADPGRGMAIAEAARRSAIRRAGIHAVEHHLSGRSADQAARSPIPVPWAIYPLPAADCAALICDLVVFETIIAADALAECLRAVGLHVDLALPSAHGDLNDGQDVLHVRSRDRTLTVHSGGLTPLLYELLEPRTWANGVAELFRHPLPLGAPVVRYAGDSEPWLPGLAR